MAVSVLEVLRRVLAPGRQQAQAAVVQEQAAARQVGVAQQAQQRHLRAPRLGADHGARQPQRVALVLHARAAQRVQVLLDLGETGDITIIRNFIIPSNFDIAKKKY